MQCVFLLAAFLSAPVGCGRDAEKQYEVTIWGGIGRRDGRFVHPRAVEVEHDGNVLVLDETGRIQRFSPEGRFLAGWRLPTTQNGTAWNMAASPDGEIFVPDTHYSRVLVYSRQGELVRQWGEYGESPGQFIYPVGVDLDAEGRVFVGEYGGNDRIQVFSPEGKFLYQWGAFGTEEGQFRRPGSLAFDAQGKLWVADMANCRLQVFGARGKLLTTHCGPGDGPGELRFPYGIAPGKAGKMLVVEYGNNRIQIFDQAGGSLRCIGGPGRSVGEFAAPRGIDVDAEGRVFVADWDNHRVQCIKLSQER